MSFFCLSFQKEIPSYLCDYFYSITPQLFYREPHWIFGDLTKVLHLYPDLHDCENEVLSQLGKTGYEASFAFAATPHEAEALSQYHLQLSQNLNHSHSDLQPKPFFLKALPISSLFDLQGLSPWIEPNQVWSLIEDLESLGFDTLDSIIKANWSLSDWLSRWGAIGKNMHQKLFLGTHDTLIPLYTPDNKELRAYQFYERPIHSFEWLKNEILELTQKLIIRLSSTKKGSKTLKIICYHEFDRKKTEWTFKSLKPSLDFNFWRNLIEESLLNTACLKNPIEEIEILFQLEAITYSQISLFDSGPQLNESKLHFFLSWLRQKSVSFGFLHEQNHPFFEHQTKWSYPQQTNLAESIPKKNFCEPTYLIKNPIRLSHHELNHLVLHPQISERFDTEEPYSYNRHYFLARNSKAQWMWIFYNPLNQGFYMHGYFD